MIDKDASLALVKQCQLLGISRSSVYYQRVSVSDEDLMLNYLPTDGERLLLPGCDYGPLQP